VIALTSEQQYDERGECASFCRAAVSLGSVHTVGFLVGLAAVEAAAIRRHVCSGVLGWQVFGCGALSQSP
jgi:hypothetical protein